MESSEMEWESGEVAGRVGRAGEEEHKHKSNASVGQQTHELGRLWLNAITLVMVCTVGPSVIAVIEGIILIVATRAVYAIAIYVVVTSACLYLA